MKSLFPIMVSLVLAAAGPRQGSAESRRARPDTPRSFLCAAEDLLKAGKPDRAAHLAAAAARNIRGAAGHVVAAQILEKCGRVQDAVRQYELAIENTTCPEARSLRRLHLAEFFAAHDLSSRARRLFKDISKRAPVSSHRDRAASRLKETARASPQPSPKLDKIIEMLDRVEKHELNHRLRRLVRDLRYKHRRAARLPSALRLARERVRRRPRNASLLYALADMEDAAGNYNEAVAVTLKALQVRPDDPLLLRSLSGYYQNAGEHRKAIACLERLSKLDRWETRLHYPLALAYARAGDAAKARKYARLYCDRVGRRSHALYALSRTAARSGHLGLAVEFAEQAAKEPDGRSVRRATALIRLYRQAGRHDKVPRLCRAVLESPDATARERKYALEQALNDAKDPARAKELVNELREDISGLSRRPAGPDRDRSLATRYAMLAAIHQLHDNVSGALKACESAAELAPDEARYSRLAGELRMSLREHDRRAEALVADKTLALRAPDPFRPGQTWLAARDSVIRLSARDSVVWAGLLGASFKPLCIAFDSRRVWIGADKGLLVFDRGGGFWNRHDLPGATRDASVVSITPQKEGRLKLRLLTSDGRRSTIVLNP